MILDQYLPNTIILSGALITEQLGNSSGGGGIQIFLLSHAREKLNITYSLTYLKFTVSLFVTTQARPGLYSDGHTWRNIPECLLKNLMNVRNTQKTNFRAAEFAYVTSSRFDNSNIFLTFSRRVS